MAAYTSSENATHYSVSYLLSVPDAGLPILGWSLVADPALLGADVDVASVTTTRTADDGSISVVQAIPYTGAPVRNVTLLDRIEPGSMIVYGLTFAKTGGGSAAPPPAGPQRLRQQLRRRLQQAASPPPATPPAAQPFARRYDLVAVVRSEEFVTVTRNPTDLAGPDSASWFTGAAVCDANRTITPIPGDGGADGGGATTAAAGNATTALIGPGGCVSAILRRTYTRTTNLTTLSVTVYGNASAAPGCASWLDGLGFPAFVGLRMSPSTAVGLLASRRFRPRAAFTKAPVMFVLPYRVSDRAAFTFRMTVPEPSALSDVCEQDVVPGQLPNTCILEVLDANRCAMGVVVDTDVSAAPVGPAPGVDATSSPPRPPATIQEEELPRDAGADDGLSRRQIGLIVGLVVGFFVLLLIVLFLFIWFYRRHWLPVGAESPPSPTAAPEDDRKTDAVGAVDTSGPVAAAAGGSVVGIHATTSHAAAAATVTGGMAAAASSGSGSGRRAAAPPPPPPAAPAERNAIVALQLEDDDDGAGVAAEGAAAQQLLVPAVAAPAEVAAGPSDGGAGADGRGAGHWAR
ncbi:hypothetical protein GPECTOR_9g658 [Gonium pectorale]|uniref:Uncharacterized protein n=1 Tax=Gonium pectorale TaxID=33097 RepID=A0A150GS21_GONPE|nr:hypothetical protein GPECTOR_9g658 [Gonium pectorale]|eukprot:KXZ52613.1 hypothetical protein GPECTOR_9g658 [Gonium pectorale]